MDQSLDIEASDEEQGITAEVIAIVEALGLVARRGKGLVAGAGAADPARVRLVLLGLQLGLWPGELSELLDLYDDTPAHEREFSHFVELLSRYQRYVSWRTGAVRSGQNAPWLVAGRWDDCGERRA